ncbi:hypothetical protein CcaverHIS002_0502060 [Cutaneotrichosporon cavernicola]|uniref:Uncharacterized protein n=1 Tax=Cutaneotrichosporon cavernicola TaxID=279322 RepID=A0AA48L629_9TREE|nr:uncharacterized protein CcaverHIS019_0502650 [Cutaneotrichosporon cavernicola]BEI84805.1 hypothetical protein CcaverHIS002_0502060 [Cutaneotrichosporon cavernicola]BEI92637.1 hypothetical protein CcaverHIS019_0502650 [Cutaneotrichosporon cavernicola]BEJ00411.1 hypothetical protein CcaverHIS631_0502680 [Cutaneotrichosporon cavernicola]BEJ08181.1 hypothetical protein CcaverHIS641_0502660 [Cutaneotrichosporon cavernicola]
MTKNKPIPPLLEPKECLTPVSLTQIHHLLNDIECGCPREQLLELQLEVVRNANDLIMQDYLDLKYREKQLSTDLVTSENRAQFSEMDLQIVRSRLEVALDNNTKRDDLIARGARVVEQLEKRHTFELDLVANDVPLPAVISTRQACVEEEKMRFLDNAKALFDLPPIKAIEAYGNKATSNQPGTHLPKSETQGQQQRLQDPVTPPRQIGRLHDYDHNGAEIEVSGLDGARVPFRRLRLGYTSPLSPCPKR